MGNGKMIVHQYALSPYCEKLRRVLKALEIPFEVRDYMPISPEDRAAQAELVEKSGHNQMPVLERDGTYTADSFLITKALLEEFPDRAERIYPADVAQRALCYTIEFAAESVFTPEGRYNTAEYKARKGEDHAEKIIEIAVERRDEILKTWDAMLAEQPYFLGDKETIADMSVVSHLNAKIKVPVVFRQLKEAGHLPDGFDLSNFPLYELDPGLKSMHAWCDRMKATEV